MQLEKGILICDINEFIITLTPPVSHNSQSRVSFLTIFTHNTRVIVWISCKKMLWVVIAINNDFTQRIVNMYICAALTDKVFQELGKQAQTIPVDKR